MARSPVPESVSAPFCKWSPPPKTNHLHDAVITILPLVISWRLVPCRWSNLSVVSCISSSKRHGCHQHHLSSVLSSVFSFLSSFSAPSSSFLLFLLPSPQN